MKIGTRKRSFEKWVVRRQIHLPYWLDNKGISSLEELSSWCDINGLDIPTSSAILDLFSDGSQPAPVPSQEPIPVVKTKLARSQISTRKTKTKKKVPDSEKTETWHTPAADRPRRQRKKKA